MTDRKGTMGERMLLVETWQTNHEQRCAERWGALIKLIGWGGAVAFTVTLGLAGWGLKTVYEGQQQQTAEIRQLLARR